MAQKNKPNYILYLILALINLLWFFHNFNSFELIEYRLVEHELSGWLATPFITRIFLGLMLCVSGLLIFNINPRKFTLKLSLLLLIIAFLDISREILGSNHIILHCYGCISDITLLNISVWIFAFILTLYLLRFNGSDMKWKWVKFPVVIILLSIPFVINPVYPQDFRDETSGLNEALEEKLFSENFNSNSFLLAVFSPGCKHCQRVGRAISVEKKTGDNFPEVKIAFGGKKEYSEEFLAQSNVSNLDYLNIEDKLFFELSGGRFPMILFVENDTIKKKWDGRTFNYFVLNELSKPNIKF
ncbi:MAG: hypothetical protein WD048_17065 [Chitinophagales bacterium]